MNLSARTTVAAMVVAASAALAIPSTASAFSIFFGEDVNNSESTPLAAFPNANAAEAAFLSNLIGVGTEDFEGFTAGTVAPLNLVFPGAGTATLTGGSGEIASVAAGTTNGFGRYGTSATNYWEVDAGSGDFVIDFSAPVAAFGFYGVDIGDFGGQLELQLNDAASTLLTVNNTQGSFGSTGGSVFFYGIIISDLTEQFSQISFNMSTGQGDAFAFDDMTVGSREQAVIPVPAAGVLLLSGMALAGVTAVRRKRSAA
jgi:hypothetical protein